MAKFSFENKFHILDIPEANATYNHVKARNDKGGGVLGENGGNFGLLHGKFTKTTCKNNKVTRLDRLNCDYF